MTGGGEALARAVASFPVYRTYVEPGAGVVDDADRDAVAGAADMAADVAEMLLLERPAAAEFVTRFQQTTPPVVAKGVEDTAFYRFARLLALCDVGRRPGALRDRVADRFHAAAAERARRFPRDADDDDPRHQALGRRPGADRRAHLGARAVGGARPALAGAVRAPARRRGAGRRRALLPVPDAGGRVADRARAGGGATWRRRCARPSATPAGWTQNAEWEQAVSGFVAALYDHPQLPRDFDVFARELAFAADCIALRTVTLKLTAPGVPDIYQGDEMPLYALVDPDNRRPVDWQWNEAMLGRLAGARLPEPSIRKLWLTKRLLGLRVRRPAAFAGGYEPLSAPAEAVAYLRGGDVLVAVATRPGPPDGALEGAEGRWRDVLTGDERLLGSSVPLAELLDEYGIAVLERA